MPRSSPEVSDKADKEKKREEKARKRRERWDYRVEKVKAATAKALAVANKRKWLVFLIGAGLLTYFTVSTGSFSSILEMVKGLFDG